MTYIVIIYLVGVGVIALAGGINRWFNDMYPEEVVHGSRMVVLSPIWPIYLAFLIIRGIIRSIRTADLRNIFK